MAIGCATGVGLAVVMGEIPEHCHPTPTDVVPYKALKNEMLDEFPHVEGNIGWLQNDVIPVLVARGRSKFPLNATPCGERHYSAQYQVTILYLNQVMEELVLSARAYRRKRDAGHDTVDEEYALDGLPDHIADVRYAQRHAVIERAAAYTFMPTQMMIAGQAMLRSTTANKLRSQLVNGRHHYWMNWLRNGKLARWWRGEVDRHVFDHT
jgi:hypothetical protein